MLALVTIALLSYLIGAFPSSILVSKIYKDIDIRKFGSGNAGTTNTFRILGWKAGSIVALIDLGKGFLCAKFVSDLTYVIGGVPDIILGWHTHAFVMVYAGLIAVLGHMFPVYVKFKGGKGVITAAGMLFAIEPISISLSILLFAIVLFVSRYVSLASVIATFFYPLFALTLKLGFAFEISWSQVLISSIASVAIILKHIPNMRRLIEGKENRVRSFAPAKGWLNKGEVKPE